MKIKRRIWALVLSVAMIITYLPALAFADDQVPEAAEPVSARYEGFAELQGVVGTDRITNLDTPDINQFIVTFSDGSEKAFYYIEREYKAENDYTYPEGAFCYAADPDDLSSIDPQTASSFLTVEVYQGDGPVEFIEGRNKDIKLQVIVHYVVSGEGTEYEITDTKIVYATEDVVCPMEGKPIGIEFMPAEGFKPECTAKSNNYLDETLFYGEGNAFMVTFEGWEAGDEYSREFRYLKETDASGETVEGFFAEGGDDAELIFDRVYCDLAYGEEKEMTFTYSNYVEALDAWVGIPFTTTVKATKLEPDVSAPTFVYNGKVKNLTSKSFRVYDNQGKRIPSTDYTVKYVKSSKIGWHSATIRFNKSKYVDSVAASYGIIPAAPKLTTIVSGNKRLTVKWKKLTTKQLKNVDGFYIELSTDKQFIKNYKRVWVSKKLVKSGKKLVKGLKKGKKYYVRVYSYKKVGGTRMKSNFSKRMYKKTK